MARSKDPILAESLRIFKEWKDNYDTFSRKKLVTGAAAGGPTAVFAAPMAISAAGYTSTGIAGGSFAAWLMGVEAAASGGGIAAGGVTATLQSAGAVGMGLGLASGVLIGGALIGTAAAGAVMLAKRNSKVFGALNSVGPGESGGLTHGNIVAIYAPAAQRFVRLMASGDNTNADGYGGKRDIDKLPLGWHSEQFLVVQTIIDKNQLGYSFYGINSKRFLSVAHHNSSVKGGEQCAVDEVDPSPYEVFKVLRVSMVKVEETNQTRVTVRLCPIMKKNSFLKMNSEGKMGCGVLQKDNDENDFFTFEIIVLMEPTRTPKR